MPQANRLRRSLTSHWGQAQRFANSLGAGTGLVLWYALLVLTIPAVSRQWPLFISEQWPPIRATAPVDFLLSPYGLVYLLLCGLAFIAFILLARRRRVVFLAFAATLVAIQVTDGTVGWDRFVIATVGLAVLGVLIEAIRQNLPFFREVHRSDVPVRRLLIRSLILWSPLLIFLVLGVLANKWLVNASARFIYETTPIDEYCSVSVPHGDRIIPCTNLDGRIAPEDVTAFGLDADASRHIRTAFLNRQRAIIEELNASDPALVGDQKQLKTLATRLAEDMSASEVLAVAKVTETEADRIARDATLRKIDNRIREIDAGLEQIRAATTPTVGGLLGQAIHSTVTAMVANVAAVRSLTRERGELEKQRKKRQKEVQALVKQASATTEHFVADLQVQIYNHLVKLAANPNSIVKEAVSEPFMPARRARIILYVIQAMATLEEKAESGVRAILRKKIPDGGTPEQIAAGYAALAANRYCTALKTSATVTDEDGKAIEMNTQPFQCWELPANGQPLSSLGLRQSADHSIRHWQSQQELRIEQDFRATVAKSYQSAADSKQVAVDLGESVPGTISLGRKKCSLFLIGNCIGNYVKRKTENGYGRAREKMVEEFNEAMIRRADEAADSVAEQLVYARQELSLALQKSVRLMHNAIDGLHQIGIVLSALLTFFLILAVIKSLLYVFATELFDSREVATIELDRSEPVEGQYVADSRITIPRSFDKRLITKSVLDNQQLRRTIAPWPLSAPLSRILRRAYFAYNKGSHRQQSINPMSFSQAEGKAIVDWQMQEGEEVVFDYRNFFGASENIQLKTTISLRLSTLLLGRFVFHSARCTDGSGRLLLVTNGQVVKDQSSIDSTPLDRLIAFSKHTRFRVDSERTMRSVFMDGYTIVRVKEPGSSFGLVLVEAIGSHRSLISGSIRFVKMLLLPF